jgi:hypothetical protein
MAFSRGSHFQPFPRSAPALRPKEGPVLAVGGRAIVTCQNGGRVTLTDEAGTSALAPIADGVEVEVLAWRPRRGATRYRVMSIDGGLEGWVGAVSLKACPPPPSPPKAAGAGDSASRLGLPVRVARGVAPRTRSAPALAEGAAIKIVTRATKSTRIGTR